MKSRKNLTRFTYETAAFEGWRLCLSRDGTTFTKYFSDKFYGGPRKSLKEAERVKETLIKLVDNSCRVDGKLSKVTILKGQMILENY